METSMKDMAAALAKQSEAVRRTMLHDRLESFYAMPEAEREKAMKMMAEAVYSLPEEASQQGEALYGLATLDTGFCEPRRSGRLAGD